MKGNFLGSTVQMFNKNFNFNKNYQETISDEIRNLLNDTGIGLSLSLAD